MATPAAAPTLPREKLIIEPKSGYVVTFFANERTYLQWFNAATLIAMTGIFLLSFKDQQVTKNMGVGAIVLALIILIYSMRTFYRRVCALTTVSPSDAYVDVRGPTLVTVSMGIALLASIVAMSQLRGLTETDPREGQTTSERYLTVLSVGGDAKQAEHLVLQSFDEHRQAAERLVSLASTLDHQEALADRTSEHQHRQHMSTMATAPATGPGGDLKRHVHTQAVPVGADGAALTYRPPLNIRPCILAWPDDLTCDGLHLLGAGTNQAQLAAVSAPGYLFITPLSGSTAPGRRVFVKRTNLMGVTAVDVVPGFLYMAQQDLALGASVIEYNLALDKVEREFRLSQLKSSPTYPVSALAFVPVPVLLDGGYMYVASSQTGVVDVYEMPFISGRAPYDDYDGISFITSFRPIATRRDILDMHYDAVAHTLYLVYPSIASVVTVQIDAATGLPSNPQGMQLAVTTYRMDMLHARGFTIDKTNGEAYVASNFGVQGGVFRVKFRPENVAAGSPAFAPCNAAP